MRWHLTGDIEDFLARAGDFLRSRPALHTSQLTRLEKLRAREEKGTLFGRLERDGEVRAICYLRPSLRLILTPVAPDEADALAADLAGHALCGVTAEDDSATAFAEAWHRRTGMTPEPGVRVRLHRLGTLTPPDPMPEGRASAAPDHAEVVRWCSEFATAVGDAPLADERSWAASNFAGKRFTFWETGVPVAMAGSTPVLAGMVWIDPVYTPVRFRGRGYAGAVTVAASQAALAAGATDVVLYTDPANVTSNALYRRLGFVPIAAFRGYDFR
ncbi:MULTISPECIES: GNAT family N-acetyltransferase [unclassified Amycolatopsis]|uniref:GNAT family N-acetyltransferase n=1 Tax=unclassified Amycolatopsis TaxID=2618356 RepID=UPI002875A475|nr:MULTISPECIES: GNAT family N-acetyltransferase [unclassified Amycolatopsis]MDS0134158.1 GNAT family N-acetyltransferase [Amycolatopsis sp. 505]MDS0145034.1 GNAT family N-acetyltransferase [Amycolatopsis sp. CM201R]